MAPSSDIYIEGTESDPASQALASIEQAQREMQDQLAALVPSASDVAFTGALADFCTGELHRYLTACDQTLYAAASGAAATRLLVGALRTTGASIRRRTEALGSAGGSAFVAAEARAIEVLLAAHLAVEQTVLLPALAELPGADLPVLAADLRTLLAGGRLDNPLVLDVREIPHGRRHPQIFARFARLAPGEAFTLVNNHDPKPLRREFQATHPDTFTWEYLETGPERWQVRIGRGSATDE